MTELNFKLEVFEGPLDLLLMLIQKHKLNIQDVEITVLLDQFLLYLERMTEADMEVTSDFLEMAARLILIKSAALLPKEEAEQLKRELQGALIELALCKTMAERLKRRYQGDTIFVRAPVKIDIDNAYRLTHQPEEILLAYGAVSERSRKKAEFNMRPPAPVVEKSYVTVFTGVFSILKSLRLKKTVTLGELYEGQPRSRKVATFLAVLELSKDGRIIISEDGESIRLATAEDRARALAALENNVNDGESGEVGE
ncbi:MAG: segregation/condensation protein A [Lachnospiraceae bacterium]|nr:segregation/condensation protein A [Ruminococcus sp.]MCM1274206.1 segregation/condensation protein A [Lachnospiraceae bacterium]